MRDLEPSTPPKSGPLLVPRIGSIAARTSVSGANGVTFMDDAIDRHHHTDKNKDLDVVEPTSPVVNCMGQVGNSLAICTLVCKNGLSQIALLYL